MASRGGRAWEDLRDAASDRRSGAAEIARRAAEALAVLPPRDLPEGIAVLLRAHPSMAPLWRLASEAAAAEDHAAAASAFAGRIAEEPARVAARAARLLRGPVVTHSYSSTLVAAAAAGGGPAVCLRSEPGGEGRMTAARLALRGVDARVAEDHAAAEEVEAAAVAATGADAIGPGGVVNKVGTGALAAAARRAGRPVVVVAGASKLFPEDLPARLPFERVPLDAFDAVVTDEAELSPEEAARLASAVAVHPDVVALLREVASR